MVSETDRVLVEAKAMGVDIEAATAHPMRTMFKLDLIASSSGSLCSFFSITRR